MAGRKGDHTVLEVCGREVRLSNPGKVFFPQPGLTKLDLANYYLECEEAVVRHLRERPTVMKRWVDGVEGEPFFQKRVPESAPEWLQTATVTFPSGRHARELVPNDAAHLRVGREPRRDRLEPLARAPLPTSTTPTSCGWISTRGRGCPSRRSAQVALGGARGARASTGCAASRRPRARAGSTSTCASSRDESFEEVRRAALALAREVERRMPGRATSRWWKEEREGVFIDYNQNARDRTVASAYSVRAVPDARVSCPLEWEEVARRRAGGADACRPCRRGCASAATRRRRSTSTPGSLDALLELAARDEREGLGDAPWPPHFRKRRASRRACSRAVPARARRQR